MSEGSKMERRPRVVGHGVHVVLLIRQAGVFVRVMVLCYTYYVTQGNVMTELAALMCGTWRKNTLFTVMDMVSLNITVPLANY